MQINRRLGIAVVLNGAIVMWIAVISANVADDQLADPIVGHFAVHTIRYLILAAAAVIAGGILIALGGPKRASAALGALVTSDRLPRSALLVPPAAITF